MLHLTCVRQCKYWGILRVTGGDRVLLLFWHLLLRWRFVNSCFAYKFISIFKHRIRKQEHLLQCLHSISSEFLKMLFCTNAVGRLLSVYFSSSHLASFIHGEFNFLSFKVLCVFVYVCGFFFFSFSLWCHLTFPAFLVLFEMIGIVISHTHKSRHTHLEFSGALMWDSGEAHMI